MVFLLYSSENGFRTPGQSIQNKGIRLSKRQEKIHGDKPECKEINNASIEKSLGVSILLCPEIG
jgi:hypothetical protein